MLADSLAPCENRLLAAVRENFQHPALGTVSEKIGSVITADAKWSKSPLHMRTQICFAVKVCNYIATRMLIIFRQSSVSSMLDVARKTYSESMEGTASYYFC